MRFIFFLISVFWAYNINAKELIINASEFGILNDGKTINTSKIQEAIDFCNKNKEGGKIIFDEGVYLTGAIVLKSNVRLHLNKDAILSGSTNPYDYLHLKSLPKRDDSWLGLIVAYKENNISITGDGLIDGNGTNLALNIDSLHHIGELIDKGYNVRRKRPQESARPTLFHFAKCKDILIENINLKNAASWGLTFDLCENLTLENISFENRAYWNNDGFDISDCKKVRVRNCYVNAADDAICLKSHHPGYCNDDIIIENCIAISSASAVKFGTASSGGFKNIIVRNIKVKDTFRSAIAIEGVDGGDIENILVENIYATNTGNAIFLRLGHRSGKRPSIFRNVTIRNLYAEIPFGRPDINYDLRGPEVDFFHNIMPSSIVGIPGHKIENVTLENIEIIYPGRASKAMAYVPLSRLNQVPENIDSYPEFTMFGELPSWGFYIRHVDGLKMKNIKLGLKDNDFRPPFVFDDTSNIIQENVKINNLF